MLGDSALVALSAEQVVEPQHALAVVDQLAVGEVYGQGERHEARWPNQAFEGGATLGEGGGR